MDDLERYLRQGEPGKAEKAKAWRAAIGLQQVDGLKPSEYLIETAKQNIDGEITIEEAKQRIDSYYAQRDPVKARNDPVNTGGGTVKGGGGTINDTVFSMMKRDKYITAIEISELLNISLRTVRRQIKELKEKGAVERIGSDKTGHWKILDP